MNSDIYYYHLDYFYPYFRGKVCPNDPHFYQTCDKKLGREIKNAKILCEHYICSDPTSGDIINVQQRLPSCDEPLCVETDAIETGCTVDTMIEMSDGSHIGSTQICDGECDIPTCEDEAKCNGFMYGIYCKWKYEGLIYVPPVYICGGYSDCDQNEDEINCTVTEETENSCRHFDTGELVPVHNYTRCTEIYAENVGYVQGSQVYCSLEDTIQYQTNCTDASRVGLVCEINGYKSSVSKFLMCRISVCDDKIDSACLTTSSCRIHKHYMCDNIIDCEDIADERNEACLLTTKATCIRRIGIKRELPIPISWINDGVKDCENGVDETDIWPICGIGKTSRYVSSKETECKNVFICRTGNPGYVELDNLCDGLETCGNENMICSVSSRPQSLKTSVPTTDKGLTKTLSYCQKGLINLELLIGKCVIEKYTFLNGDVFGVDTKTSVILPDKKQTCDYMYGEQYLYTSCTGRCLSSTCPLRNIPRYEVCPNQIPNRIGTIVNNEYLVFVTKSYGNIFTNRYFVCDNKEECIDHSKVCDLIKDCKDGSDEQRCTNHFQCNSSGKLIPKTRKCDGQVDCTDFSDECNEQCSKEILKGYLLKGLSWLIGILAVVANLVIIVNSLRTLNRCRTTAALINRLLILVIALGDFFVGCYLFIIATYDAIIFGKSYCSKQITWITSLECSVIGVFSTVGSQISLFAMAGLSLVRIHGIWNSMRIPGEVTVLKFLKIAATMLFLISTSVAIALLPIMESFEDFFVNGVKFSDQLKIFIGISDKGTVSEVIKAYYGRTKDNKLDWKMLIQMVKDMYSHDLDYEDITLNAADKVEFYGNDGVCLFKYFVQDNDPQKHFVWSILVLNFICFVFISVSYLLIGILSRRSSENLSSSQNNQQLAKRNKRMNRRIGLIITTDFLCWVPFIVICMLHSLEVIDATPWYSIFSMIILPINSVINPFLYDNAVTKVIVEPSRRLLGRVSSSEVAQTIREFTSSISRERQRSREAVAETQRQRSGEAVAETQRQRSGKAVAETHRQRSGEAVTETQTQRSGEAVAETQTQRSGEAVAETQRQRSGKAVAETQRQRSGEAVTKTQTLRSGEAVAETQRQRSGEAVAETQRQRSGKAVAETQRQRSGEAVTETQTQRSEEAVAETQRQRSGEAVAETQRQRSGEAVAETII